MTMLVQPPKNLAPLMLLDPEIPGRTEPALPSGEWGINLAAAKGNFPNGLKVQIPIWSAKNLEDKVELLLNGDVVDHHTIADPAEVDERTTLWVAPRHLPTGSYTLSYRVIRPHQAPETHTPALKLYVKLELPGGQDTDPEFGHSELHMAFEPPEVVRDGVDKDTAKNGVKLLIQAKPGSVTDKPYPDMAVGDVCKASWGGKLVSSAPVTAAQINDPANNPLIIHVTEAIILAAGDSDPKGLAVTFMISDLVNNTSEDWCAETRIVVDTGSSRLEAPLLAQANGNQLDLDRLGDEALVLQVWVESAEFQVNDVIIMHLKGTTLDGETIEVKERQSIDKHPAVVEVLLPNAAAHALAKTQGGFSYELERAGTIVQRSKGRFINIIGEPRRLAAPVAEDEHQGAIEPDLPTARIRIPFDPLIETDMAIELKWFGTRPDGTTYDPQLEWFFPSAEEAEDPEGFVISVEGKHLKTLDGGMLDLSYNLLSVDDDERIISRGSWHAALLKVGEPQLELIKPIVLGEQDGALEPADLPNGASKLTAPRPTANPTKAKDVVTYTWLGEVTGRKEDSIPLNALSANKDVNFTLNPAFVAEHIEPNRGKKITVSYRILRFETGKTSYSNPLEFSVGTVLKLKPPSVKEASGSNLNPLTAKDTLTVIVPQGELLPTDLLNVTWTGAPGTPADGSDTSIPRPVSEGLSIPIDKHVVAFNLGKNVAVSYSITRGTGLPIDSPAFDLAVLPITPGHGELPSPKITQASGNILDLSTFAGDPGTTTIPWPLIAAGQRVWLRCHGTNVDNSERIITLWTASAVQPHEVINGLSIAIPRSQLELLKDNSELRVALLVTFDRTGTEANAVVFPEGRFTVRAIPEFIVDPTPLTLNGRNFTTHGTELGWTRTHDPVGTFAERPARGGTPPYTYVSSNLNVASVDSNGTVRSEGNGTTIIIVSDASNPRLTKTYTVTADRVSRIIRSPQPVTHFDAAAWVASVRGRPLNHQVLPQEDMDLLEDLFRSSFAIPNEAGKAWTGIQYNMNPRWGCLCGVWINEASFGMASQDETRLRYTVVAAAD